MSDINDFICDTCRQLATPGKGLECFKNIFTFKKAYKFLSSTPGWMLLNIKGDEIKYWMEMGVGEIIPNVAPSNNILDEWYFGSLIKRVIQPTLFNKEPFNYYVVMNFDSFCNLANMIYANISSFEKPMFMKDHNDWKQEVNKDSFWCYFQITESCYDEFSTNRIGEVFYNIEKNVYSDSDFLSLEEFTNKTDEYLHKIVLNSDSIIDLFVLGIEARCKQFKKQISNAELENINIYEFFGGNIGDMMSRFEKMNLN